MTKPERIIPFDYFPTEEEAIQPLSANTKYDVCWQDCNYDIIGTIEPVHPTFTNGTGKEVVQLNAVLIGGNGLNA